ncbi:MAG: tetratricopeptide repeat protein [Flavobacteriales bacterium]|nr:tetratricopeptide repeat protein [Flavobacteriales bacterium]
MRPITLLALLFASLSVHSQDFASLETLYEEGEYQQVIDQLGKPTDPEGWLLLGDSFHKLGDFDKALFAYDGAEDITFKRFELYLHRGICLFSLGDYDRAREDLLNAHDLDQHDARIPYYLAAGAYMCDDFKLARNYLEDALRLDPDYYEAHYLKGAVYMMLGKPTTAEASFVACAEMKDDDQRLQINLALALQDQFRFEEAMAIFDKLVINSEDQVLKETYYHRGHCRFMMHQEDLACEDWANCADMGDTEAMELVAKTCSGKEKKAKKRKRVYMAF